MYYIVTHALPYKWRRANLVPGGRWSQPWSVKLAIFPCAVGCQSWVAHSHLTLGTADLTSSLVEHCVMYWFGQPVSQPWTASLFFLRSGGLEGEGINCFNSNKPPCINSLKTMTLHQVSSGNQIKCDVGFFLDNLFFPQSPQFLVWLGV